MKNFILTAALLAGSAHAGWGGVGAALDGYNQGRNEAAGITTRQDAQPTPVVQPQQPYTVMAMLVSIENGTSLTGAPVMRCTYTAMGQQFVRAFSGYCPNTVQVR